MNLELLRDALLWSTLLNYALFLWWFVVFTQAHDWMRQIHGRWFQLGDEARNRERSAIDVGKEMDFSEWIHGSI